MTMPHIEYAGGHTLAMVNESRRSVIANAPAWARKLARETYALHFPAPAQPAARPPVKPAAARQRPGWGWVSGVCSPGVSTPVYGHSDGQKLPEQFTSRCWESILRSINDYKHPVTLTLGHDGPVLASTPHSLKFRLHSLFGIGLEFVAPLRSGDVPPAVAAALQSGGLGVSVGFTKPKQWIVERAGVGRVRIIDDCVLDHVALLPPDAKMKPVYAAARCFGVVGSRLGCSREATDRAVQHAYRELKRQAGCRE
jgi:hypothetical protein